jgi:hypothetical protein
MDPLGDLLDHFACLLDMRGHTIIEVLSPRGVSSFEPTAQRA